MPCKRISVPGLYLTSLLASGDRPFCYRRGVHRLLGMPSRAEAALKFLPPLPPVGFQYERDRAPSGHRQPVSRSDRGALFSPGVVAGELTSVGDRGRLGEEMLSPAATTPAGVNRRVSGQQLAWDDGRHVSEEALGPLAAASPRNGPEIPSARHRQSVIAALSAQGLLQENAASAERFLSQKSSKKPVQRGALNKNEPAGAPTSKPGSGAGDGCYNSQRRRGGSTDPQHTGLEIPGITHRRSRFAALSAQGSPPKEAASAQRSLYQTAGPKKAPQVAASDGEKAEFAGVSSAPMTQSAADIAYESEGHQAGSAETQHIGLEIPGASSVPAEPSDDDQQPARVSTRSRPHADSIPRDPVPAWRSSVSEEKPVLFRSRPRANEEVEHLRQVVTNVATRQASVDGRRREEPLPSAAEHGQPALAQPVVVVQRAPAPIFQAPRAFWASSVLRSTHLRMLR